MPSELQVALIRELRGTICRCGKPKQPKQTFCRACYYALSPDIRTALYRRIGAGYEEAYYTATSELSQRRPDAQ